MYKAEYDLIEQIENYHFWYRAMEDMVIKLITKSPRRDLKILDAGCGGGGMSEKMGLFGEVTAIDVNPNALAYARQKNIHKVVSANVESLPFNADSFDLVICLDVLYHKKVTNDLKALGEFRRVLKKNGMIILRLPAFEFLRGSHDNVVATRHRYTGAEVKAKMQSAGFKIVKNSYANMILSLPLIIKRNYESYFKKNESHSDSFKLPPLINNLAYFILTSENSLLSFIDLPFGSSVIAIGKK